MTATVADAQLAARMATYRILNRRRELASDAPPFERWCNDRFPTMTWDAPQHRAIFDALAGLERDYDKLMIFMPPRHGKSQSATVRYSAYTAIYDGARFPEILIAAYNLSLARTFTRQVRNICLREGIVAGDQRAADEFATIHGTVVRAAGVQSGITGKGGDLIVIDDPIRGREEADSETYRNRTWDWYNDDLLTRRGPKAKLILIQTRWHTDDLAGRILASEDGPNWHVLHLPAIALDDDPAGREPGEALWPERFPVETLRHIEATNPRGFAALYQGMPVAEGGAVFLAEWWSAENRYDPTDGAVPVARVTFWDTAEEEGDGSAYTVGVTVGLMADYRARILDVVRQRVSFPRLLDLIDQTAERHDHDGRLRWVDVEYASSGRQAFQTLAAQARPRLRHLLRRTTPRGSKVTRASSAAAWMRVGMVQLPLPHDSVPWLHDYEQELLDFPSGAYADQVDATSGAINRIRRELEHGYRQRANNERKDDGA